MTTATVGEGLCWEQAFVSGLCAEDLRGDEVASFASGTFMLEGEDTPLAPAAMRVLGPRTVELTLTEGRYHQVRRMFVAAGNHVQALERLAIGGMNLDALPSGEWRLLDLADRERMFAGTRSTS